ncbi:MAG: phosphatidate cytidylyltransferase, partial [Acidimicrobiales bacterium]
PRATGTLPHARPRPSERRGGPGPAPRRPERNIGVATMTGAVLAGAALLAFSLGSGATMVLVAGIVVAAAAELFAALRRGGYQPATLLGLVATAALVASAYWKGEAAIPLVLGLTVVFTLLWYLVGVTRVAPTINVAVSVFGVAYVGVLGAFAALILTLPNGIGVLIGVIVAVVANDIGALATGRRLGQSQMARDISPGKSVEGLIGGTVASVAAAVVVLGTIGIHPWETGTAVVLGLVVSVVAPLGDLCESMIKRDLGIKDMGTVLPGHGGMLDRFDAMLFALPAAYYVSRLLEIF